jgi:hypothetical protein
MPKAAAMSTCVALAVSLACAAPALAAPQWGIEVTHRNPYCARGTAGQLAEVEAGKEAKSVEVEGESGEKESVSCGLDPFSGSATSFDQASGFNAYTVAVQNAAPVASPENTVKQNAHVTVTDEVPEGMAFAGKPGQVARGRGWTCRVEELPGAAGPRPRKATCTRESSETELKAEPGGKCYPQVVPSAANCYPPITLHVFVEANAPEGTLTDTATVEGGEASPLSASTSDPTTVTPQVPFGINTFGIEDLTAHMECKEPHAVSFAECPLESERKSTIVPYNQAGGHPFAVSTNIIFNYTTNFEGKLVGAGGGAAEFGVGPKEVEADVPPGLVGDPQSAPQCPLADLREAENDCPESQIGYIHFDYTTGSITKGAPGFPGVSSLVYNAEPPPGHPAAFAFLAPGQVPLILYPKLRSDGDYGFTTGDEATGPLRSAQLTFCGFGSVDEGPPPELGGKVRCAIARPVSKPFLTNPTRCYAPVTTLRANPYPSGNPLSEPPGSPPAYASMRAYLNGHSGSPARLGTVSEGTQGPFSTLTGCDALHFHPSVQVTPSPSPEGTTQADEPSGMTITLAMPESNPSCRKETLEVVCPPSEPAPKTIKVTFPEGITVSPGSADGLTTCSDAQFGLGTEFGPGVANPTEPAREAQCPPASQVGTVEVFSPLLANEPDGSAPLKGELYVGQPDCGLCSQEDAASGRLLHLFLQMHDRKAGLVIKLHGSASLNRETGRITSSFENQPQLPFEKFVLHMRGGPRASFVTPQSCGAARTRGNLTPWSETGNARTSFSFNVDANGAGGACPAAWPFFSPPSPNALLAGSTYVGAGEYSPFSLTLSREDRETNINELTVHMPPGLTAKLAGVPLCPEAAANAGTCSPESRIGSVSTLAGAGPHPFLEEGQVYLTGPYKSQRTGAEGPFGLSIVVPTTAGPFNLEGEMGGGAPGEHRPSGRAVEVVRSAIEINPETAAVSIASDPLPQVLDGVPLRLRKIHVQITRGEFERNPTNCAEQQISASLTSTTAQEATVPARFEVGACGALSFGPSFSASTQAKTSRQNGASLTVKIAQSPGEASIKQTLLQLPGALPSRLTTLQHACTEAQFHREPKGCPPQSFVGNATANSPLLSVPLAGPAILVSHGGAAFPDVVFMLEGEGIHINVVGHTDIKKGITYSRFETVPDEPITSFSVTLPEGPHSALAANGNLCQKSLTMPTTLIAQDGAQRAQSTKVKVTGCKPAKTRKLKRALTACRHKNQAHRASRVACERRARKRYAVKASKAGQRASALTGPLAHATSQAAGAIATTTSSFSLSAPATVTPPTKAQEGACPNQAVIEESNENPTTRRPYSQGLPECRAYELVSPLEKQGHQIVELTAVAPGGEAAAFASEGGFAEPGNFYFEGAGARNSYVARRSASGWLTESAFAPAGLIELPTLGAAAASDFSPELQMPQIACGAPPSGGYACAARQPDGSWRPTPTYWPSGGLSTITPSKTADRAQSSDLERVFIAPGVPLFQHDTLIAGGLYEISRARSASPQLRMINVDSAGHELALDEGKVVGALLGDTGQDVPGTAYHAVSENGERAFFSATPEGGVRTVYGRVPCTAGATCSEEHGGVAGAPCTESHPCEEGRETVAISAPECNPKCEDEEPKPATFQGASADGSKVFFTTEQELLPADATPGNNLYEYNLDEPEGHRLTLLSSDPNGTEAADVLGVARSSSDGSHVYFVATGELTTAANANKEFPHKGEHNLYAYVAEGHGGHVEFVATLPVKDEKLWGRACGEESVGVACDAGTRLAQTTPNGRYLVFSSFAQLAGDANGCGAEEGGKPEGAVVLCTAQAVYRYDAASGELNLVSHGAPTYRQQCEAEASGAQARSKCEHEGQSADVAALDGTRGAVADFEDGHRAISEDGQSIVFTTSERLQASDVNHNEDVYLWRQCASPCEGGGTVSLISGGQAHTFSSNPTISTSGGDIFFRTDAALVPQDSDPLADVYDARVGGGFAASHTPSCAGEGCQPPMSALPEFAPAGSLIFTSGRNLDAPPEGSASHTLTAGKGTHATPKPKRKRAPRGAAKQRRSKRHKR